MNTIKRLLQSFRLFWSGMLAQPQPLRVGMLDTGELALVGDNGEAQVLSVRTTDIIRKTLLAHRSPPAAGGLDPAAPMYWALDAAQREQQRAGEVPNTFTRRAS